MSGLDRFETEIRRVHVENGVFVTLCRSLGEAGLLACWAGPVEPATRLMCVVAAAGIAQDGSQFPISSQNLPVPHSVVRSTATSGRPVVVPVADEWSHAFLQRSSAGLACALIPIRANGFVVGVLGCMSPKADFFGDAEIQLISHMAGRAGDYLGRLAHVERMQAIAQAFGNERDRVQMLLLALEQADRINPRAGDPAAAYREVCEIPVRLGLGSLAWFGTVEKWGSRWLANVISAAGDPGFLEGNTVKRRSAGHRASLPGGSSFKDGSGRRQVMVVDDFTTDPRFAYWRDDALREGLRSFAAAPVYIGRHQVGWLSVYAKQAGAFGTYEMALFQRLAAHLGSLVHVQHADARRRALEAQLDRLLRPAAGS